MTFAQPQTLYWVMPLSPKKRVILSRGAAAIENVSPPRERLTKFWRPFFCHVTNFCRLTLTRRAVLRNSGPSGVKTSAKIHKSALEIGERILKGGKRSTAGRGDQIPRYVTRLSATPWERSSGVSDLSGGKKTGVTWFPCPIPRWIMPFV